MRINKIEISTLANKSRYYLYNEVFSLAKENKLYGEFGKDFFLIDKPNKSFIDGIKKLQIKFKEYFNS